MTYPFDIEVLNRTPDTFGASRLSGVGDKVESELFRLLINCFVGLRWEAVFATTDVDTNDIVPLLLYPVKFSHRHLWAIVTHKVNPYCAGYAEFPLSFPDAFVYSIEHLLIVEAPPHMVVG